MITSSANTPGRTFLLPLRAAAEIPPDDWRFASRSFQFRGREQTGCFLFVRSASLPTEKSSLKRALELFALSVRL